MLKLKSIKIIKKKKNQSKTNKKISPSKQTKKPQPVWMCATCSDNRSTETGSVLVLHSHVRHPVSTAVYTSGDISFTGNLHRSLLPTDKDAIPKPPTVCSFPFLPLMPVSPSSLQSSSDMIPAFLSQI